MRHREVALGGKSLRFPFKTDGTISLTKGGIILGNLSKGRFLGVKNSKPLGGGEPVGQTGGDLFPHFYQHLPKKSTIHDSCR